MGPKPGAKVAKGPRVNADAHEDGNGLFRTIMAAIKDSATEPGDTVTIMPGVYKDPIVIESDVSLVGEGPAGEVVIKVDRLHALSIFSGEVKLENLKIHQAGKGAWWAVNIAGGTVEMKGCDVTSDSVGCIGIGGDAAPTITGNTIHHCKGSGVVFLAQSQGTLADNEIHSCGGAAVEICEASCPTVTRNKIHSNQQAGVLVYNPTAQPEISHNEIYGNAGSGIEVAEKAGPTISKNKISSCHECGLLLHKGATATVEDNEISHNLQNGVAMKRRCKATVRKNNIHHNLAYGICGFSNAGGQLEENKLTANGNGGLWLSPRSRRSLTLAGNVYTEISQPKRAVAVAE